jgi:hypothetical protein
MMMRVVPAIAGFVLIAACGGGPSNEANGSYRGQSIDVSGAFLLPQQATSTGSAISVVVLSSADDACTRAQSSGINNTHILTIALGIAGANATLSPATKSGTYQVSRQTFVAAGTMLAGVSFGVIGTCGVGTQANAASGSVNVTRVATNPDGTVGALAGTFEAVFDTGEKMSGSFDVSTCASARLIFAVCG